MNVIMVITTVISWGIVSLCAYLCIKLSILDDVHKIPKLTKLSKVALLAGVLELGCWLAAVLYITDGCM